MILFDPIEGWREPNYPDDIPGGVTMKYVWIAIEEDVEGGRFLGAFGTESAALGLLRAERARALVVGQEMEEAEAGAKPAGYWLPGEVTGTAKTRWFFPHYHGSSTSPRTVVFRTRVMP